jgi:hypothetical protein
LPGTIPTDIRTVANLPDEPCHASWPRDYFLAPPDMLDWTPTNADTFPILNHPPAPATRAMYNTTTSRAGSPGSTIGSNEGRLTSYLRAIAQRKDPAFALCEAAKAFAGIAHPSMTNLRRPTGPAWGNAFADLAVTGRAVFARFRASPPTASRLLRSSCPGVDAGALDRALDRAYAVASAIRVRGTETQPTAERRNLGWIAVSGEDDKPYRPVNVPTAPFPQFNVTVDVRGIAGRVQSLSTRYLIAHARPPTFGLATTTADGGSRRVTGDLRPTIAPDAHVLLFIHGMDSRAEEAVAPASVLHRLSRRPGGKNWTVISLDMPTQGYADNIDPTVFGLNGDVGCHHTPLLDFLESFIVRFVDAVDRETDGKLKPRIRAVVGGSFGGNMSLRLGRRNFLPGSTPALWIRNVVPWSPASIWQPMTNRPGFLAGCDYPHRIKYDVAVGWPRGMADVVERPNDRRNLFYGGFDYSPPGEDRPQAQHWWRDGFPCKRAGITGARIDRHETYTEVFRRYHWRLAAEQLAFSHWQKTGPNQTPLYLHNRTRTLLLAGEKDVGLELGELTRRTAPLMANTPGKFRFLMNTGHSLADERPTWVAEQIVEFLAADP